MTNPKPPTRRFTEGIVAMTAALTYIILGANVLGLPKWSAAIFIIIGILVFIIGVRWYRSSDFWNSHLTYGTGVTFGAKPIKGEGTTGD